MSKKLENAKNLYLIGIKEGRIQEALDSYIGKHYIQHSTGVKDGKDGFKEFFTDFLNRSSSRDIRITKGLVDGNFVFVQAYQNIDNGKAQWVTTDLFDTDTEDYIIEHWDVIDAYHQQPNDPALGEFNITDLDKTENNKKLVREFLVNSFQNKDYKNIPNFVSDNLIEHSQYYKTTIQEYAIENNITYDFIFKLIGQGNYVVAYSKVIINDDAFALFDIFRLEDNIIVEHWDNKEVIPDHFDLANSGKF